MTDRERGDDDHDFTEARQEEHHPEQEKKMIVAGEHVGGTGSDIRQRPGSGLLAPDNHESHAPTLQNLPLLSPAERQSKARLSSVRSPSFP